MTRSTPFAALLAAAIVLVPSSVHPEPLARARSAGEAPAPAESRAPRDPSATPPGESPEEPASPEPASTGPASDEPAADRPAVDADEAAPDAPETTVREEIVVSAHRLEVPRRQVGSSVTVIDRQEIERRGKGTLLELLRTLPGLEVSQGGGPGKAVSVFVRGGNTAHTLVLVDGVRVNSTTVGSFDFADLTTDNLERVEVLRGPQSTLYGSEAIGGVISVTTRRGEGGLAVAATAEGGTHAHRRLALDLGGDAGRFDFQLALADLATDGVSAASEARGNREDDPYDNTTLSGRLGLDFGGDGRADLALRRVEGETEIDGFAFPAGPVDDPDATQEREAWIGSLTLAKPLGKRLRQTVRLGLTDEDLAGRDPSDSGNDFTIESRAAELFAQSDLALSPDDTLTLGAGVEERRGVNRGTFDERVTLRSAFLQHRTAVGERLHLTAGVRLDDHSEFGSEATYRVAGSAGVTGGTRLHGSWGTGFRAPSLNELFFPGFGNPDLAPETSRGVDLGVELTLAGGRWLVDLTGFDNRFEDLIVFDLATFTLANVAEAEARGIEALLAWSPREELAVTLSHTWTDSEDLATGEPLPRRPEHRTAATVDFQATPALSGSVALFAVRDRIDSDGTAMDDYERVDLFLARRLPRGLRATLRLENLLDEDYEEINGFTSPGFAGALGIAYAWSAPERR